MDEHASERGRAGQGAEAMRPGSLGLATVLGAASAALSNLVLYGLMTGLWGLTIVVQAPGSPFPRPLTALGVVTASVLPALVAGGLLLVLVRRTSRPYTLFLRTAGLLLMLSMIPVLLQPIPTGSMLSLMVMHALAAAAIVSALLRTREGRSAVLT